MSPTNLLSNSLKGGATLLGAVGIGAIALLGAPEAAKAAACGPGSEWVRTCDPGIDEFKLSWAYLDLLFEGVPVPQTVVLSGPATVERLEPMVDANGVWYIDTILEEEFTGTLPGIGPITVTGTGTGRIVENPQNTALADSFFDVFAEISADFDGDGDLDQARNTTAITVYGNKWLVGVPPNDPAVDPVPPTPDLNLPPLFPPRPPSWNASECDATDPLAAIIYCGFEDVEFFLVDDQGNITDQRVATLLEEKHVVHPVPEPSATVPLALLGLAGLWGLKKKHSSKQG